MSPGKAGVGTNSSMELPSNKVVITIAAYTNTEAVDLPPLFHTIDPDALDSIVESMEKGHVTFPYSRHTVTVNANGEVSIDSLNG